MGFILDALELFRSSPDLLLLIFAGFGVGVILIVSLLWAKARRDRKALSTAEIAILSAREQVKMTREAALGAQLDGWLADLETRADQLRRLRAATEAPFQKAVEEAKQSKTVERIARFSRYRDELQVVQEDIDLYLAGTAVTRDTVEHARRLLSLHQDIGSKIDADINSIGQLIGLVLSETPAATLLERPFRERPEWIAILGMRDRVKEIDRAVREKERVQAELAFRRDKSVAKATEQSMMPRGQR